MRPPRQRASYGGVRQSYGDFVRRLIPLPRSGGYGLATVQVGGLLRRKLRS